VAKIRCLCGLSDALTTPTINATVHLRKPPKNLNRPTEEHRVAELTCSYTLEAFDTLVELMRDGKNERVRGTAAQALLDRGWDKARKWKWLLALRAAIWTS
jgi:hypothetical protein